MPLPYGRSAVAPATACSCAAPVVGRSSRARSDVGRCRDRRPGLHVRGERPLLPGTKQAGTRLYPGGRPSNPSSSPHPATCARSGAMVGGIDSLRVRAARLERDHPLPERGGSVLPVDGTELWAGSLPRPARHRDPRSHQLFAAATPGCSPTTPPLPASQRRSSPRRPSSVTGLSPSRPPGRDRRGRHADVGAVTRLRARAATGNVL